jgi:hypothetical protein
LIGAKEPRNQKISKELQKQKNHKSGKTTTTTKKLAKA